MAIKFENIKPGMTLWDVRKATGFRLSRKEMNYWPVFVSEVDQEKRTVLASWNGNRSQTMNESQVTKYRAKRPNE
jgi:hypothetical protein